MKRLNALICLLLLGLGTLSTQPLDTRHPSYPQAVAHLAQLQELLAIPNDAHYPEDIEKNVQWCEQALTDVGFTPKRLPTPTVPLLMATYNKQLPGKPTVLYYFHIDGQPVDPAHWYQDDPYQVTLRSEKGLDRAKDLPWERLQDEVLDPDWRMYARSSSDDKGPFVMFMAALNTLHEQGVAVPYNLKIILDFEEEIGSPRLPAAVKQFKQDLAADMLVIHDGPKHPSHKPTISFGARGITSLTLTVHGPNQALHSGHYGNYAPNPAMRLAELLASMKDAEGRVTIPGYYDGIELDAKAKAALAAVPDDEAALWKRLGIAEMDKVGSSYQESIQYPSLNVRGMASGWVGKEVRTIVPATATAELDLRLVVESDGRRLIQLVKQHIQEQGYYLTEGEPTTEERAKYPKICQVTDRGSVTDAFRTDMDSELGRWTTRALAETFGEAPVRIRTMGGTLPISPFINTLDVPAVVVPLVNSDNNQHSPNENLRLGHYVDGVKAIYGLLKTPVEE